MGKKHKVWKDAAYRYLKECELGMAKATDLPFLVRSKKGRVMTKMAPRTRGITVILRGDDRFEEIIMHEGTEWSGTRRCSYWKVRDRRDDENAE